MFSYNNHVNWRSSDVYSQRLMVASLAWHFFALILLCVWAFSWSLKFALEVPTCAPESLAGRKSKASKAQSTQRAGPKMKHQTSKAMQAASSAERSNKKSKEERSATLVLYPLAIWAAIAWAKQSKSKPARKYVMRNENSNQAASQALAATGTGACI